MPTAVGGGHAVVTHGINTEVYLEIFSHIRGEREREQRDHREQEREHQCLKSDFKGCVQSTDAAVMEALSLLSGYASASHGQVQ